MLIESHMRGVIASQKFCNKLNTIINMVIGDEDINSVYDDEVIYELPSISIDIISIKRADDECFPITKAEYDQNTDELKLRSHRLTERDIYVTEEYVIHDFSKALDKSLTVEHGNKLFNKTSVTTSTGENHVTANFCILFK